MDLLYIDKSIYLDYWTALPTAVIHIVHFEIYIHSTAYELYLNHAYLNPGSVG